MSVKEIGCNYPEPINDYYKSNSKVGKNKKKDSDTAVQNEKIVYEKTIPNSVLSGLESIKFLEKQIKDSKFFVNSVDENAFEELSDINFVVNSEFLDKIGKDEKLKKQFEDDVLFLSEFTKKYKKDYCTLHELGHDFTATNFVDYRL